MTQDESPFACDLNAIPLDERPTHLANTQKLFSLVQQIQELPDGYSFRLPNENDVWKLAAEFVDLERLCCPFFAFRLEFKRQGDPIYLTVTGAEGVKPFIMAEIGEHLTRYVQVGAGRISPTS